MLEGNAAMVALVYPLFRPVRNRKGVRIVRPIKSEPLKGVNQPRLGLDEAGRKVVFKTNLEQGRSEAEAELRRS
jgi:hypothetical protein